ncbi:MAG: PAS domain S-box-containing protein [Phenylobacterium sp.]|jgi:PAS domain S-box-containing protein
MNTTLPSVINPLNQRHISYWLLALGLFIVSALLRGGHHSGGVQWHTLMETVSTMLALFIGVMALLRYYTRKDIIYLMVGSGFLGTFFLDGYHSIVTSTAFKSYIDTAMPTLIPWSWLASRQYLSIFLFMCWLLWKIDFRPSDDYRRFERALLSLSAVFTLTACGFFAFTPLPPAYTDNPLFHRPAEFFPGLFFALALCGYLRKGKWRTDAFEHWLIYSLIINLGAQVVFMATSTQLFDGQFDLAHLLKIASYGCVLIGLMISMFQVFRRDQNAEQELSDAVREAKQQAQKTSDKLIEIFENSPISIGVSLAKDDSIVWINSCGAKLLGFDNHQQALGFKAKNCWLSRPQRASFIRRFAQLGSIKAEEVQLKNQQGKTFWCYLSWDRISFEGENCILFWMYDITREKAVQQQLFSAEKQASLGRLVAGVAHEINTPIGISITAATYMLNKTEHFNEAVNAAQLSKKQLDKYLNVISEGLDITFFNLKKAANLVESFKQVSVDRISEKPRVIKLHLYFEDIIQSLNPKTKQAEVNVLLNCPKNCTFYTLPGALAQITANLISNSILHGFDQQTNRNISIDLSGSDSDNININYQDNGHGISEDILSKVIDPFFTTKRKENAVGLGLSIVHNIVVDTLLGTIKLTSHYGEGVQILISIPALRNHQ